LRENRALPTPVQELGPPRHGRCDCQRASDNECIDGLILGGPKWYLGVLLTVAIVLGYWWLYLRPRTAVARPSKPKRPKRGAGVRGHPKRPGGRR
jgi:hypothetical protein